CPLGAVEGLEQTPLDEGLIHAAPRVAYPYQAPVASRLHRHGDAPVGRRGILGVANSVYQRHEKPVAVRTHPQARMADVSPRIRPSIRALRYSLEYQLSQLQ